jgi:hypothetical protein
MAFSLVCTAVQSVDSLLHDPGTVTGRYTARIRCDNSLLHDVDAALSLGSNLLGHQRVVCPLKFFNVPLNGGEDRNLAKNKTQTVG